jgi:carbamoyltransferase
MTCILGINAFHGDSSACLLRDGKLVAAAEEERFRRIKHWAGFPREAIRYCLSEAGVTLRQVDHVAVNQDSRAHLGRKLAYALFRRPDPREALERIRVRRERGGVAARLALAFPGEPFSGKVHAVEHHVAHMASAFHVSPFREAVVVSVDGFGDFASAAWGVGSDLGIRVDGRVYFPHSLGIFYQALTQYLGFRGYGDESKVMGLASYGRPLFLDAMRRILILRDGGGFRLDLSFFRHHRERIESGWENTSPEVGTLFAPALADLLGPPRGAEEALEERHMNIACSVQARYEEAFFHLLNALHDRHGLEALAVAGGCGMNAAANGRAARRTPFKRSFFQPAAGDAGGAIGAACTVWHRLGGSREWVMDHAYWGPRFETHDITHLLEGRRAELASAGCTALLMSDEEALCRQAASALAAGRVVGWFQGRMEWGPRALGNRSILCDPRRADMRELLNARIKHRESFRPFAPSVLKERARDWFEIEGDAPFMMQALPIRETQRARIPAVAHVDGSGRLQTVDRGTNPRYHRLIESFEALTGVPILLNTSFNDSEPVVCAPGEALECFLRTGMDLLVMGDWVVRRDAS